MLFKTILISLLNCRIIQVGRDFRSSCDSSPAPSRGGSSSGPSCPFLIPYNKELAFPINVFRRLRQSCQPSLLGTPFWVTVAQGCCPACVTELGRVCCGCHKMANSFHPPKWKTAWLWCSVLKSGYHSNNRMRKQRGVVRNKRVVMENLSSLLKLLSMFKTRVESKLVFLGF